MGSERAIPEFMMLSSRDIASVSRLISTASVVIVPLVVNDANHGHWRAAWPRPWDRHPWPAKTIPWSGARQMIAAEERPDI